MLRAPLAVLVFTLCAFALARTVHGDPRFAPSFEVNLTNPTPQSPSDVRLSFQLALGPQIAATVIYLPRDWGIVPGDRIPVGTKVGFIDSIETFGFINSSCDNPVSWRFELLNASLDPGTTVSLRDTATDSNSEGFGMRDFAEDKGKNGLLDGIDHYPDYLDAALRGERPLVRLAGVGVLAGQPVLRQLLIFPPDTRLNFPD